jgi:hypothetical protein
MSNTSRKNMDGYTPTQHLRRVPHKVNGEVVGYDVQKYTVWSPIGQAGGTKSQLGGGLDQMATIPEGAYVAIQIPTTDDSEVLQIENADGAVLGYASRNNQNFSEWTIDIGGESIYIDDIDEASGIIAFVKDRHKDNIGNYEIPEGWVDTLTDDNYTTKAALMDKALFTGTYEGAMSPANVMNEVPGGSATEIVRQISRETVNSLAAGEKHGEFPSGIRFPTKNRSVMIEVAAENVGGDYPMYTIRKVDISNAEAPSLLAEEIYVHAGDLRDSVMRAASKNQPFGDKY